MSISHEPIKSLEAQLGARLRDLRHRRGLSRPELAAALGVTAADVRRFETAGRMDAATAWELSRALRVPLDALFEDLADTAPALPRLALH